MMEYCYRSAGLASVIVYVWMHRPGAAAAFVEQKGRSSERQDVGIRLAEEELIGTPYE